MEPSALCPGARLLLWHADSLADRYDLFVTLPYDEQLQITKQARKFAKAMRAPLVFCSTREGINVQRLFKIVLAKAFDLTCNIKRVTNTAGEPMIPPLLEY